MVQRDWEEIQQSILKINWDFEDYSSTKYPLDINSIPWYPATFPAPIPKYLIALLSEHRDVVFDPFGGKGTTVVEALKQGRRYIYNDLNPHAVSIVECIFSAINHICDEKDIFMMAQQDRLELMGLIKSGQVPSYTGKDVDQIYGNLPENIEQILNDRQIKQEVVFWFHCETLAELIKIYDHIRKFSGNQRTIRKLAFVSILKEVCSQRGHFSYVTDNCRPTEMKYYDAIDAYCEMLNRIQRACIDYNKQYTVINQTKDLSEINHQSFIHFGDARDCHYIDDKSVDLIITSPPYLCAQDYVLTMRLNDFFYPNDEFNTLSIKEIGPRRLRNKSGIVDSYFLDMQCVITELYRVLKDDAYFCLVIGQGKGKVSQGIDVIDNVIHIAVEIGFDKLFRRSRNISFRTNRVGGVDKEDIIIFRKK